MRPGYPTVPHPVAPQTRNEYVAADLAPLGMEGLPAPVHHPARDMETVVGRRHHVVQPRSSPRDSLSMAEQPHSVALGTGSRITAATVESPVR